MANGRSQSLWDLGRSIKDIIILFFFSFFLTPPIAANVMKFCPLADVFYRRPYCHNTSILIERNISMILRVMPYFLFANLLMKLADFFCV